MPLLKSKSKKAFSENVGTEMEAGKPQKQALAIAYSTQRHAKKKKMALGGAVESPTRSGHPYDRDPGAEAKKPDDYRRPKESYDADQWAGAPELDDASSTAMRPPEEQYMGSKWAEGGEVPSDPRALAMYHQSQAEKYRMMAEGGMIDEERPASIAEAILRKRKFADGGMVDLEENSEEHPNGYYGINEDTANKEQYDDSQISPQPEDSNEKGDSEEDDSENKHDMISTIRNKMKAKGR